MARLPRLTGKGSHHLLRQSAGRVTDVPVLAGEIIGPGLEGFTMLKVPEIMPVTDLRQDAAAALKRVRASKEPLVITQRGRAAAVILSIEAYERGEQERHLLRLLARGEKEIATGQGYDLDEVLGEAVAPPMRTTRKVTL